ncbi:hypothetical protein [Flavobacterium sp. Root186]|uniref:hypothetical protein n=1 Tax=Flavobacterium sp. Root186 TaxID=1736485 RepID=UPI0006FB3AB7|nr:hypothetical protein [Flavobacterium sp. Root186]KRB58514.1 hypothetical protein ASD98_23490 [Flavobacterium sp. Root186]
MKKWFTTFLFLFIFLLDGHANSNTQISQSAHHRLNFINPSLGYFHNESYLDTGHSFETFKRKAILLDNEETEENFSAVQKLFAKSTYFLSFLCRDRLTSYSIAFTKKVNYRKIFSLLYVEVNVLFQVFRI